MKFHFDSEVTVAIEAKLDAQPSDIHLQSLEKLSNSCNKSVNLREYVE